VDGDTSTNDTVIGLASGAAGNARISDAGSAEARQLEAAVTALLQVLGFLPAPLHACRGKPLS
jgi:glutamate N-acetyltransferase/amino-acid N-acetyltransferase